MEADNTLRGLHKSFIYCFNNFKTCLPRPKLGPRLHLSVPPHIPNIKGWLLSLAASLGFPYIGLNFATRVKFSSFFCIPINTCSRVSSLPSCFLRMASTVDVTLLSQTFS